MVWFGSVCVWSCGVTGIWTGCVWFSYVLPRWAVCTVPLHHSHRPTLPYNMSTSDSCYRLSHGSWRLTSTLTRVLCIAEFSCQPPNSLAEKWWCTTLHPFHPTPPPPLPLNPPPHPPASHSPAIQHSDVFYSIGRQRRPTSVSFLSPEPLGQLQGAISCPILQCIAAYFSILQRAGMAGILCQSNSYVLLLLPAVVRQKSTYCSVRQQNIAY